MITVIKRLLVKRRWIWRKLCLVRIAHFSHVAPKKKNQNTTQPANTRQSVCLCVASSSAIDCLKYFRFQISAIKLCFYSKMSDILKRICRYICLKCMAIYNDNYECSGRMGDWPIFADKTSTKIMFIIQIHEVKYKLRPKPSIQRKLSQSIKAIHGTEQTNCTFEWLIFFTLIQYYGLSEKEQLLSIYVTIHAKKRAI